MDVSTANVIKGRAPLRATQALRAAMRKRGKGAGTLTFFHSPKNDRDFLLPTDLEYMHALLLEANESVASYDADPDRIVALVQGEGHVGSKPDAIVTRHNGQVKYVEVKYKADMTQERAALQAAAQSQAAAKVGASWEWFTEEDAERNERLVHDWLHIVAVLGQMRWELAVAWPDVSKQIRQHLIQSGPATLGELREHGFDTWQIAFSATFRLIQLGALRSNLSDEPLSPDTVIGTREARHGQ